MSNEQKYEVDVKCSRCAAVVHGVRGPGFTGGFYDVSRRSYWHAFARPNEKRLCDNCMHNSPEYQFVYGVLPGMTDQRDTPRGRLIAHKMKQFLAAQAAPARLPAQRLATQGGPVGVQVETRCLTGAKSPVLVRIGDAPKPGLPVNFHFPNKKEKP